MSKSTLSRLAKNGDDFDGTKSGVDAAMPSKRISKRQMSKPLRSAMEHTLSPSKSNDSGANKTVVPAKRVNRFKSTPCGSLRHVVVLSPMEETGANNKRATKQRGTFAAPNVSDTDVSSLIAMNCKLTSEVLDTKKLLSDKNNALLEIQKDYFAEQLEVIALKKSNLEKDQQIDMLRKEIEQIRAERFCTDLIRFDEEGHSQDSVDNPENTAQTHETYLLGSDLETEDEAKGCESDLQTELDQESSGFQWTPTD